MKIKKSYRIKGETYKIKIVDNLDCAGQCDPDKRIILINKKLNNKNKILTLYHELGHALLAESGIIQTSVSHDMQEIIVENFSYLIFYLTNQT